MRYAQGADGGALNPLFGDVMVILAQVSGGWCMTGLDNYQTGIRAKRAKILADTRALRLLMLISSLPARYACMFPKHNRAVTCLCTPYLLL